MSKLESNHADHRRLLVAFMERHPMLSTPCQMTEPAVDQLPVGIFRKDAAGRFVFVNHRFCKVMGIASDRVLGQTVMEIATGESRNPDTMWPLDLAVQASLRHALVMETGQPAERDEEYRTPDGHSRHFHIIESALLGPHQTIDGCQGVMFEITRHKRVDEALHYERDLLRALLDNSPDHIYFKDLQSRFIKSSTTQALQFGMKSPDGLVGKTDFDVFSEEHARPAFEDEQEIMRTGLPMVGKVEKETWIDGRSDSWALTTKMPLRNRDGEIIGTFGITKDISELKEAERRIADVHKQLLEASRMAGMAEIAINVLHNVGNVLNSVTVSAGLIGAQLRTSKLKGLARALSLMDEHDHELGEYLTHDSRGKLLPGYLHDLAKALESERETIAEELRVLTRSVDHIKEIVATQQSYAGGSRVVEASKLDELLDDALRMNAGSLTRHSVSVVRDIDKLPVLLLDRHRLLQILVNLISNAKHATTAVPDGSPCITFGATLSADGGVLRITVADNGEGIAPENLTRIFAHGFTTRTNGHGFGLHSCALAAKEMGGTLTARSEGLGLGATFVLEIPIETPKRP